MQSLATGDLEKIKILFPYIGKKPPRIGREVVNAFEQSGCEIFVDLFCGSLAMLCYLSWDVKVVVNDINGNLTNLYTVIRDSPSDFVSEVMKLPYSEVVFQRLTEDLKSADNMSELNRAVAYFYASFGAYRGRMDNPLFHISTTADTNRAEDYYENVFSMQDHRDLAEMLKSHKGKFALSSKAKKDLRKLYRSNKDIRNQN